MNMYSIEQVAEMLNFSTSTIKSYIKNKKLSHYKFGTNQNSTVRISQEQIDEFLSSNEVRRIN